ncbi:hypothetical protein ACFL1M_03250 [Patescibacteria group bacterium]
MKVYLFGNPDHHQDNIAFKVADKLQPDFQNIIFEYIKPNQDIPFINQDHVYILDAVMGIKSPKIITQEDLDRLILPPRSSAHDYDLAFQLKYLIKLKKLKKITIIGIPLEEKLSYDSIHSIFKKLVAQDIQGS